MRNNNGIELLYKCLISPCKKGLKTTPLKPLNVRGNIPKVLKSILNLTSTQNTIHRANTKNKGQAITEVEKTKDFCFIKRIVSKIQPKRK